MPHKINLKNVFRHHPPTLEQIPKYEAVRAGALAFAEVIEATTPDGPDKSAAIRLVREAMMTANAGIALDGQL
jgi:hypothetical protein